MHPVYAPFAKGRQVGRRDTTTGRAKRSRGRQGTIRGQGARGRDRCVKRPVGEMLPWWRPRSNCASAQLDISPRPPTSTLTTTPRCDAQPCRLSPTRVPPLARTVIVPPSRCRLVDCEDGWRSRDGISITTVGIVIDDFCVGTGHVLLFLCCKVIKVVSWVKARVGLQTAVIACLELANAVRDI